MAELGTESVVTTSGPDIQDADKAQREQTARAKYRRALIEHQKDHDQTVEEFFKARRDDLRRTDLSARLKLIQDIDQACRYFNGEQYGDYDDMGVYQPYTLIDGDFAYTINIFNGHVEQAFMQLMKTKVEYAFTARNRNDPNILQVAKMCEELATAEKDRLMSDDLQSEEVYNSILAGESARVLMWAVDPDCPRKVKRVRQEAEEIDLPPTRYCEACKSEVEPGAKQCDCGASFITEMPGGKAKRFNSVEYEVPLAENVLRIPHMMSVQRSLSALRPKDSTFIVERDYLSLHAAQWKYQIDIQPGSVPLTDEVRLRQEQERASGQLDAIVGSSRHHAVPEYQATPMSIVQREHIYLDPGEYGWFYVREEVTLPDGTEKGFKLKRGFLGDQCPDGVYLMYLGDTLARFQPVNRNRVWSFVLYGKRAGSSRGAGLQVLIPLQDIVNDTFNLDYTILMTVGQPLTVISRKSIKELPEAGQFIFVDNLPSSGRAEDAVARFPGQAGSGVIGATSERIAAAMQFIAGTYTLGAGGAPDAQNASKTATEVSARLEQQNGRMFGPIKQRIAADKTMMFQILENIRDFSAPEQKRELIERFGPDTCELFFKTNFRQALNITVAENSDMPRSMALTQANTMAFAQVAQGLATAQVPWAGELLATIADVLGIPFSIGQGRNDRREAEYRLNKVRAIEERVKSKNAAVLSDPNEGGAFLFSKLEEMCGPQSLAGIEDEDGRAAFIFMQDHEAFKDVYKDFLFGEAAKTSSDALKLCVVQLWMEHEKARLIMEEERAKWMQQIQETLNPPPPEPDPEQLAAMQEQEEQKALTAAAIQREDEEEAKDADFERQQLAEEAALDRKLTEQEFATQQQVAAEAARAAMQPGQGQQ